MRTACTSPLYQSRLVEWPYIYGLNDKAVKKVLLLAVVFADGDHYLPHLDMAGKDQRFGEVFQHHKMIIREADPLFTIVLT